MKDITLDYLRESIIKNNVLINTPFGKRHLFYADYTASERGVTFIEEQIAQLLPFYVNTHTDDSTTGADTTKMLHLLKR